MLWGFLLIELIEFRVFENSTKKGSEPIAPSLLYVTGM